MEPSDGSIHQEACSAKARFLGEVKAKRTGALASMRGQGGGSGGRGAGAMVDNPKKQEGVHRVGRGSVACEDANAYTLRHFRIYVASFALAFGHGGRAGRLGIVNEHGRLEIAVGEDLRNVGQEYANLLDSLFVVA